MNKKPKSVAVIGQGYVGLPLSISLVSAGWDVTGIDIALDTIEKITKNLETDSSSYKELNTAFVSKKYRCTNDFSKISDVSVVVICVPTPLTDENLPDYSYLLMALSEISKNVSNQTLIISESTSAPGTLRNIIAPYFLDNSSMGCKELYFAVAPERINPGDEKWNQRNTPRIVAGLDAVATKLAFDFYSDICDVVITSSVPEEVEAAKLLENAFRLINISFINEYSRVCRAMNLDPNEIVKLAGSKPFGFMSFDPGIGIGGHCIPVDPIYFSEWAKSNGQVSQMLDLAVEINRNLPVIVVNRALELLGDKKDASLVMIIGISYKPDISDIRESPSIAIAKELEERGIQVIWHDPLVVSWNDTKSSPIDSKCDLIILAQYQSEVNYEALAKLDRKVLNCTKRKIHGQDVYNF